MSKYQKRVGVAIVFCFSLAILVTGIRSWNSREKAKGEDEQKQAKVEMVETKDAEQVSTIEIKNEEEEEIEEVSNQAPVFHENSQLLWPVSGNILMRYSMDHTVYFKTLDQYKYNPASIISGAENDNVIASAAGIIKSIDLLPQTGTTVTIDMGNGYECIYGQLKDVTVKTGDTVQSGTVIGYLNEPTKYYTEEGYNLYFEMRKDGQPIDPINYMVEE